MTAPVILSLNPIKNWTEAGKVDDAVIESFLWEEWRKNFEIYV
jgi:hypothetical protein